MVQAGEMGLDYEHCLALQRKLEDIDNRVDEGKIETINNLADKLIRQGRSDTQSIQQRRQNLNNKYVLKKIILLFIFMLIVFNLC